MASIGHIAVGMAASRLHRRGQVTRVSAAASMALWSALSLLPDTDVIGFRFGVRYADEWGHRGATHSLAFALGVAALCGVWAYQRRVSVSRTTLLAALVLVSHGLLDTLTDGGLGCALLWPWTDQRYFASLNPIPVAPLGLYFFSSRGLVVAIVEIVLFAPLLVYAMWPRTHTRPLAGHGRIME